MSGWKTKWPSVELTRLLSQTYCLGGIFGRKKERKKTGSINNTDRRSLFFKVLFYHYISLALAVVLKKQLILTVKRIILPQSKFVRCIHTLGGIAPLRPLEESRWVYVLVGIFMLLTLITVGLGISIPSTSQAIWTYRTCFICKEYLFYRHM